MGHDERHSTNVTTRHSKPADEIAHNRAAEGERGRGGQGGGDDNIKIPQPPRNALFANTLC